MRLVARLIAGAAFLALLCLVTGRIRTALVLALAGHALFCLSAIVPNVPLTGPLVRRFRPTGRDLWLTLDDGPDPVATPAILEVLRRHEARATFFVIGERAAAHSELLRAIVAAGHTLGNHTHTHPSRSFWNAGSRRIRREIDRAAEAVRAAGVSAPGFFRPPVGLANVFLAPVLAKRGMFRVGWSARGFDTRPQSPAVMVERIARQCRPGAIVLFHEIGATAGAENLDRLLARLRHDGYRFVLPGPQSLIVE